jgi:hypothetical protein
VKIALGFTTLAVGLLAPWAHAAITVNSTVDVTEGIRAQAIITEPTGLGSSFTAVAIKEVRASMLLRDGNLDNGLVLKKKELTAAQAYGLGLPFGYNDPPPTNPGGPWKGLVWPYRDQYDYFPGPNDPLGNDVGVFYSDQPGVYGFVNVNGIARGGPTDPTPAGGDPNLLLRGITGNGLENPATYFALDIDPLYGPFDRTVRLQIFAATAVVVQKHNTTGEYSEIIVQIPDFVIEFQIPEPGTALAGSMLGLLALKRTRRNR